MPGFVESLVQDASRGDGLPLPRALALATDPALRPLELLAAASRVREAHFGDRVSLCAIVSARSGGCGEDCAFCAQSRRADAGTPATPLLPEETLVARAHAARAAGATEFSVVTSGRQLGPGDLARVARVLDAERGLGLLRCASLGTLSEEALRGLADAGLQVFHHNLEAGPRFYPRIVTSRAFEDNVRTVRAAKAAGLEVCSGGVFGMGETWEDRIELLGVLRDLGVGRVPVNFLNPIPGTPLGDRPLLPPWEALRILALARLVLPRARITVAGGREVVLRQLQPLVFAAGATGILIGDYLTTRGRAAAEDLAMIHDLGLRPDPLA